MCCLPACNLQACIRCGWLGGSELLVCMDGPRQDREAPGITPAVQRGFATQHAASLASPPKRRWRRSCPPAAARPRHSAAPACNPRSTLPCSRPQRPLAPDQIRSPQDSPTRLICFVAGTRLRSYQPWQRARARELLARLIWRLSRGAGAAGPRLGRLVAAGQPAWSAGALRGGTSPCCSRARPRRLLLTRRAHSALRRCSPRLPAPLARSTPAEQRQVTEPLRGLVAEMALTGIIRWARARKPAQPACRMRARSAACSHAARPPKLCSR